MITLNKVNTVVSPINESRGYKKCLLLITETCFYYFLPIFSWKAIMKWVDTREVLSNKVLNASFDFWQIVHWVYHFSNNAKFDNFSTNSQNVQTGLC